MSNLDLGHQDGSDEDHCRGTPRGPRPSPQETSSYDGQHYRLVDARCEPKPVQRPRLPLGIGGSGEKWTLRTVARWADHWNYSGGEPDELRHNSRCCGGTATRPAATSRRSSCPSP